MPCIQNILLLKCNDYSIQIAYKPEEGISYLHRQLYLPLVLQAQWFALNVALVREMTTMVRDIDLHYPSVPTINAIQRHAHKNSDSEFT